MRVFGLVGYSGSGKTTLLIRLIPELVRRGITVSTMKHAHHGFDVDQPGKDSYEHRQAGATEVMVSSARRWALMHEIRIGAEPGPNELMRHMSKVDILLIEGFKRERHDKLEVWRPSTGKPLLAREDPSILAVASDEPVPGLKIPVLELDNIQAIADFIIVHCGLAQRK
ncbi:MAG TPA: molybdopterin-guanine dinucleotide biosynthesis protein B [Alphaproteobacteria bacterium]|nr:molybdopterin-guanine dinucleotide biosynthesis protein B [Alphaproteobacteria bacterium]